YSGARGCPRRGRAPHAGQVPEGCPSIAGDALPIRAEVRALLQLAKLELLAAREVNPEIAARLQPAEWPIIRVHAPDEPLDIVCGEELENVARRRERIPVQRLASCAEICASARAGAFEPGADFGVIPEAVDVIVDLWQTLIQLD